MAMAKRDMLLLIIALVAGIALGKVGGPAWILLVWGCISAGLGWFSPRSRSAIINSAVFGFAASYTFMIAGYNGHDPLTSKLLPFLVFGILGALCGAVFGVSAQLVHKRILR